MDSEPAPGRIRFPVPAAVLECIEVTNLEKFSILIVAHCWRSKIIVCGRRQNPRALLGRKLQPEQQQKLLPGANFGSCIVFIVPCLVIIKGIWKRRRLATVRRFVRLGDQLTVLLAHAAGGMDGSTVRDLSQSSTSWRL